MTVIYLFAQFGLEKEQALIFSGCIFLNLVLYGLLSLIPWEMENIQEKLFRLKREVM
jgi:hypothetical protein